MEKSKAFKDANKEVQNIVTYSVAFLVRDILLGISGKVFYF